MKDEFELPWITVSSINTGAKAVVKVSMPEEKSSEPGVVRTVPESNTLQHWERVPSAALGEVSLNPGLAREHAQAELDLMRKRGSRTPERFILREFDSGFVRVSYRIVRGTPAILFALLADRKRDLRAHWTDEQGTLELPRKATFTKESKLTGSDLIERRGAQLPKDSQFRRVTAPIPAEVVAFADRLWEFGGIRGVTVNDRRDPRFVNMFYEFQRLVPVAEIPRVREKLDGRLGSTP